MKNNLRELKIVLTKYGTAFFDGDNLVNYVHDNDGSWRGEYFNPILEHFGIAVVAVETPTVKQRNAYAPFEE